MTPKKTPQWITKKRAEMRRAHLTPKSESDNASRPIFAVCERAISKR